MKNNYKKYYLLIIILIVFIIVYGIYKLTNTTKNPIEDNSKEIVYLYYSGNDDRQKVPAVNIKKISDNINFSINEFVNPYLDKEYVSIDYHYNISGNILALLVTVVDYSREGAPDYTFKSFIVNLKKLKVLDDSQVLDLFNIKIDNIVNMLDEQFEEYYNDEKNKNIINSNVSYDEYLNSHEITNFYENITFDIVNSQLIVYLDYNELAEIESSYYFRDIGHMFSYE